MLAAYAVLTVVSLTLWTPLFLRFYRSWVSRNNPVSLAICACIGQLIWIGFAGFWQLVGDANHELILLTSAGLSLMVSIYCHRAFAVSDKRFANVRGKKEKES